MHNFNVPIGVSNRHLHLSEEDLRTLFGPNAKLTYKKPLSQEGQYVCEETVTLEGSIGSISLRVLGPVRAQTQIEITLTDAYKLGITPPLRDSGDLAGSMGCVLAGPEGTATLKEGVIVVHRHIHVRTEDAAQKGVKDRDRVDVRVNSERGGIFTDVLVRVDPTFNLEFHIDTDESNAFALKNGDIAEVIKRDNQSAE
ncbi:MAG: phosphate propanoyltransferase [Peptococcaceae bacterium]|nr:phosphate propanoyltransferase [Peptococcaceae bacterium]